MIHCQKCKTRNDPAQAVCSNCGADLLPSKGIGARLGTFFLIIVACVFLPALPSYFIFRPETPNPILKWVGYFLIACAGMALIYAFYDSFRKTLIHERYAIRARRHEKLDPQQALADFTKALELVPQDGRTPQELATDRTPLLKGRAAVYKDLGMMPEMEADWEKIIELVPADERVKTLREQAVLYKQLGLVQKFRSPREEMLAKLDPNERTKIELKTVNFTDPQIPRRLCVYCASPITKQNKGTIEVSHYGKAKISYKFPLCDECDQGKNKEVDSAVTISDVKEIEAFSIPMVDSLALNFVNPVYAKAFLSANQKAS